jgi:hypothetical protein
MALCVYSRLQTILTDNPATIDDFIDVIMKDHRKYIRCLYVYNKIDSVSLDFLDKLAREPYTAVMSCELDLGVQDVVERIWTELRLIRVYTKRYFQPHSLLQNSTRVTDIIKERRRPRLLGGADRAQQLDHRGCLRLHPSDAEGDVQVCFGLGCECKTYPAAGGTGSCCCG